jgi:DNA-binding transcriptional LysR family regulator
MFRIGGRTPAGPPARLSRFKAGRKIRISGRLWMNSLPSRRAEADPAVGRPVQLLVDCEPGPAPLHLMFQPSRLASPKIRNLRPLRRRRWRSLDPFSARFSA